MCALLALQQECLAWSPTPSLHPSPSPAPLPYPYPKQECLAAFRESVRQDRGRAGAKDAPLPLRGSTADEPALRNGGPH